MMLSLTARIARLIFPDPAGEVAVITSVAKGWLIFAMEKLKRWRSVWSIE
jgi:hypothetical protein